MNVTARKTLSLDGEELVSLELEKDGVKITLSEEECKVFSAVLKGERGSVYVRYHDDYQAHEVILFTHEKYIMLQQTIER